MGSLFKFIGSCVAVLILMNILYIGFAEARGLNRTITGPRGQSVQSSATSSTTVKPQQGVQNQRSTQVSGPRGTATTVESESAVTYDADSGVTRSGSSAVTTANGQTYSTSSSSSAQYEKGQGLTTSGTVSAGGKSLTTQTQTTVDNGTATTQRHIGH